MIRKQGFQKGKNNPNYGGKLWKGKRCSEETKRKISLGNKGKIVSEEAKRKMSKSQKERFKDKTNHPMFGKENKWGNHSEETKENMSKKTKEKFKDKTNHPMYGRKSGKMIPCEICKKKFYIMPSRFGKIKTCSKECFKVWAIKNAKELGYGKWMLGKKNHITEKGLEKLRKLGKENESLKTYIKENGTWNKGLKLTKEKYPKLGWRTSRKKQIFPKIDTKIEVKIQNFLSLLHIEFFTHKYMNIEHGYQCDIFIPKQETEGVIIPQKTIIEADGCYWHGCPICKLNSYKKLGERKQLDSNRTKELQEKGFRVIRLWEHEIKQMEVNDLRDKIICKI